MIKARLTLALATLGLIAGLGIGQATVARPLSPQEEARVQPAGDPVNCIRLAELSESRVRDDQTIDFVMNNGRVYRNHLPNSCPQLGYEERFSHETAIQEICSADIITVLHGGPGLMKGASCGLGQFQPVSGVPR